MKVIYENKNFLAIEKPAGLMVHAAKHKVGEPTVVDWLLKNYPQVKTVGDEPTLRPGIVHRLDKETSGIMLIPKTQEYFEYLKSLFQKHEIKKTYYAIVRGVPKKEEGIINAPIGIRNGTLKRSVRSSKMRKEAVTEYRVVKKINNAPGESDDGKNAIANGAFSLLEVRPQTGRTHQIRVHLASIGHPIVGDKLYGPKVQPGWANRLMLHAAAIEFSDEDGSIIRLESELPLELSTPPRLPPRA